MKKIEDIIIQTLMYKGKEDLAGLLNNCKYDLKESQTYGSELYSVLTPVIIYVGIEKLNTLNNLNESDKKYIVEAFKVVYPVQADSYEINNIKFLQDPEATIPGMSKMRIPDKIETDHWEEGLFRLFISHSSQNKDIAKEFKSELYKYGISAFVAHEDINPTKEWLNVIESSLIRCDGLLAILNLNFKDSVWCDHEIGIAYGQNKIIVPVNYGIIPYGFISKYQALKSNERTIIDISYDVWKILISNDLSTKKASYGIVNIFCKSTSIEQINRNLKLLEKVKNLDNNLIEEILNAVNDNDQIYNSIDIKEKVLRFIESKRKNIIN